jgi:hypothetical protein
MAVNAAIALTTATTVAARTEEVSTVPREQRDHYDSICGGR